MTRVELWEVCRMVFFVDISSCVLCGVLVLRGVFPIVLLVKLCGINIGPY